MIHGRRDPLESNRKWLQCEQSAGRLRKNFWQQINISPLRYLFTHFATVLIDTGGEEAGAGWWWSQENASRGKGLKTGMVSHGGETRPRVSHAKSVGMTEVRP